MIDYGRAPATDEVEVTLFGPGFGEAIAVHAGDGHWILVDSCIDESAQAPAAAAYLSQLGIPPDGVRAIVASHWQKNCVRL